MVRPLFFRGERPRDGGRTEWAALLSESHRSEGPQAGPTAGRVPPIPPGPSGPDPKRTVS